MHTPRSPVLARFGESLLLLRNRRREVPSGGRWANLVRERYQFDCARDPANHPFYLLGLVTREAPDVMVLHPAKGTVVNRYRVVRPLVPKREWHEYHDLVPDHANAERKLGASEFVCLEEL